MPARRNPLAPGSSARGTVLILTLSREIRPEYETGVSADMLQAKRLTLRAAAVTIASLAVTAFLLRGEIRIWFKLRELREDFESLGGREYRHPQTRLTFVRVHDFLIAKGAVPAAQYAFVGEHFGFVAEHSLCRGGAGPGGPAFANRNSWDVFCLAYDLSFPTLKQWEHARRAGYVAEYEPFPGHSKRGSRPHSVFPLRPVYNLR